MKPEFMVDRELIEQLLVIVFGPSAQYLAHEQRDTDSYTIQIRTSLGKYRFVATKETLFNTLNNKLSQHEADQVRQQVLLADSDPVKPFSPNQVTELADPPKSSAQMPVKDRGCLGVFLFIVLVISLFMI